MGNRRRKIRNDLFLEDCWGSGSNYSFFGLLVFYWKAWHIVSLGFRSPLKSRESKVEMVFAHQKIEGMGYPCACIISKYKLLIF